MIRKVVKACFTVLCIGFLASCDHKLTYDYYMLHPEKLEKAYSACQLNNNPSCEIIKRAAHDMSELMYDESVNPEDFGKKIIVLQQQLKIMQKQNDSNADYRELCKKLNRMYAVVALHGP